MPCGAVVGPGSEHPGSASCRWRGAETSSLWPSHYSNVRGARNTRPFTSSLRSIGRVTNLKLTCLGSGRWNYDAAQALRVGGREADLKKVARAGREQILGEGRGKRRIFPGAREIRVSMVAVVVPAYLPTQDALRKLAILPDTSRIAPDGLQAEGNPLSSS